MIFGRLRELIRVFNINMSNASAVSLVPDTVRGMKLLDREKFLRNIQVLVLKLSNDKLSKVLPICKPYILRLMNFKPVQALDKEKPLDRSIHFNPEKVTCWEDISEADRQLLSQHDIRKSDFSSREVQLTYNNFNYDDIFTAVIPEGEETVSGFSQVGHIIHLNLRDHLLEYKSLIGSVLHDKIKTCKTVVNKCDIIDNTYRNFKMEVLAGEEDFMVTVKENQCTFQFDFSKVYWNPRLGKEHERILSCLKPNDILIDVFCGVGPFSVPAARKKCRVFANDLNPDSYKWLCHNSKKNKVNPALFSSYNLDGKDFICDIFKSFIIDCCMQKEKICEGARIHITMNLPALAVEFLKYFNGLIDRELFDKFDYDVIVYLYCFVIGDNMIDTAKKMVNDNIGCDISSHILDVFDVRTVSNNKQMVRVTFKLTKEILFNVNSKLDSNEPPAKKKCFESVGDSVNAF